MDNFRLHTYTHTHICINICALARRTRIDSVCVDKLQKRLRRNLNKTALMGFENDKIYYYNERLSAKGVRGGSKRTRTTTTKSSGPVKNKSPFFFFV